jgi:N-methylhydantoinase B/oxoprolinase/acetone carboxylase alpha subunit
MIDPVTLAVLKGRLDQIADEMDATLFRSAFNPIIAEAHDASHGIYDAATGDTLIQGKSGLPIFVGVMAFAVKAAIDKAVRDGDLAEGDVYLFNDGRSSTMAACSAGSPPWAIGTTSAATCRATTIRSRPKVFRKACTFRRCG